MSRFRLLGFVQKSVSDNAARKLHKTTFSLVKFPHPENCGLKGDLFSTRSLHSWCRGDSGVDVRFLNTGAFLNKRYFHATGSCQQNFYEVLGVPRNANRDDIKNAFQELAKKWHPDTNKNNPAAKRKFQEIREAFETLRDTAKRAQYNKTLRDAEKRAKKDKKKTRAASEVFSKDHNFRRDGADIHIDANINFTKAIFGGKVVVPTIFGDVGLEIPEGVQPGHTLVIRSKGFPKHGGNSHGDQYVHICVKLPKYSSLDERQRALMEEFAKMECKPEEFAKKLEEFANKPGESAKSECKPEAGDRPKDPDDVYLIILVMFLILAVIYLPYYCWGEISHKTNPQFPSNQNNQMHEDEKNKAKSNFAMIRKKHEDQQHDTHSNGDTSQKLDE